MGKVDILIQKLEKYKAKKSIGDGIHMLEQIGEGLYKETKKWGKNQDKVYTAEEVSQLKGVLFIETYQFLCSTFERWKNREISYNELLETVNITEEEFIDTISYMDEVKNRWDKCYENRAIITKAFIEEINNIPLRHPERDKNRVKKEKVFITLENNKDRHINFMC